MYSNFMVATQQAKWVFANSLALLLLPLISIFLSGYNKIYSWKHKLLITVQTPSGVVSGAAVQARYSKKFTTRYAVPASVQRTDCFGRSGVIDPADLAATFGAGFALRETTLEVTGEPVTEGVVERVLGWLEPLSGGYLHGGFTSKGAPFRLMDTNFKWWDLRWLFQKTFSYKF